MSYSTPNDFILINKISIKHLSKYLFKNDKILTDSINTDAQELIYIKSYIENLLNTDRIDATINDLFQNKVNYYKLSNYSDKYSKYLYTKKFTSDVLHIDLSYYTNKNIKKYMFIYDFLSEYYKIIAKIKEEKYFIDNETIYNNEFEIQMRYILINNIQGNEEITNIYNVNNSFNNYTILFKLEDKINKTNKDKIIQPTGKIYDVKLKNYENYNVDDEYNNIYVSSFIKLFNELINKEDLLLDDSLNHFTILSKSYKFKFESLLLNYYILKTIYFYFQLYHITKSKEIDDIITINYPIIFNNFNNLINDKNDNSIIKILNNTKIQDYNVDKNRDNKINDIENKIKNLEFNKQELINYVKNNKNISTEEILKKQNEGIDYNTKIDNLKKELEYIKSNKYITSEGSKIQEAIDYKDELSQINKKIENNKTSLEIINKNTKFDKKYLNNINILSYFINFILITVIFSLIINSVTNSLNISIPIIIFLVSILLFIIINNIIKNIYINEINGTLNSNNSSNFLLYKLYNHYSEKFELPTDSPINNISNTIINNDTFYDNITDIPNIITNNIDKDLENKLYVYSNNINYKIDIYNKNLFDNENNSYDNLNYTNYWNNPNLNLNFIDNGFNIFPSNQNDRITRYILHIPELLDNIKCDILVVGGGSFGGHIDINDNNSSKNIAEGGAGGAVIYSKEVPLVSGLYEIGVGIGGKWINNLDNSIEYGQASESYIKKIDTNDYLLLAKGAKYNKLNNDDILQLSGGINTENITLNDTDLLNNNIKSDGAKGSVSDGGKGSVIKPAKGESNFNYYYAVNYTNKYDYVNSDKRFELYDDYGENGNSGINISTRFDFMNNGKFASGGGAASYCIEGDIHTFNIYNNDYYGCNPSDERIGRGGSITAGDGHKEYGKDALPNTGSGGGGGKIKGGNGGSGIVLIKFNLHNIKAKFDTNKNILKKNIKENVYNLALDKINLDTYKKNLNLKTYESNIRLAKQDIDSKIKNYGILIHSEKEEISNIDSKLEDITDKVQQINDISSQIEQKNRDIYGYNEEIKTLELTQNNYRKNITQLNNDINDTKQNLQLERANKRKAEIEETQANTQVQEFKKNYLKSITDRLKAQVCKNKIELANNSKQEELIRKSNDKKEIKKKLLEDLKKNRLAIINKTITLEEALENALYSQKEAEENYNSQLNELNKLKDKTLPESEKNYIISLKLKLNSKIAGISGYDGSFLNDTIDTRDNIRKQLEDEKQKRINFNEQIINELKNATSNLNNNNGTFSNRYSILRVYSGNLKDNTINLSQDEIDRREKNKLINNFEESLYKNEFENFSLFQVKEHFIISDEEKDLLNRVKRKAYVEPDNITIIDLQIIAHPQLAKPYSNEILNELIKQSNDLNSKLRSDSRYLRFLDSYKTDNNENWTKVPDAKGVISNQTLLEDNKNYINDIYANFDTINKLSIDMPSYYDNVNPLLKKEVYKYRNIDNNTNLYNKININNNNTVNIQIKLKELTLNFILSIAILLSLSIIIHKFSNNIFIYLISVIILLIITFFYLYNRKQIVRTKYTNKYWHKKKNI
jgi:hypothetical protein